MTKTLLHKVTQLLSAKSIFTGSDTGGRDAYLYRDAHHVAVQIATRTVRVHRTCSLPATGCGLLCPESAGLEECTRLPNSRYRVFLRVCSKAITRGERCKIFCQLCGARSSSYPYIYVEKRDEQLQTTLN